MESVVKNCGQTVHDEVANKQTMEELKELLKVGVLGVRREAGSGRELPPTARAAVFALEEVKVRVRSWERHLQAHVLLLQNEKDTSFRAGEGFPEAGHGVGSCL